MNRLGLGTMGLAVKLFNVNGHQEAIEALNIELSTEDIALIEAALPDDKIGGKGMRK